MPLYGLTTSRLLKSPLIGGPLAAAPKTTLLLHFDGSNGATSTTDASSFGRSVTMTNGAAIATAQSVFGGSSCVFDGSNDYVAVARDALIDTYAAAFAIDFRIRPNSPGSAGFRRCLTWGNDDTGGIQIGTTSNTNLHVEISDGTTLDATIANTTWQHVALTWDGTTIRLFVGGTVADSDTFSTDVSAYTGGWTLGGRRNGDTSVGNYWPGHIDEFRASNVARWTANFTPDGSAYTSD